MAPQFTHSLPSVTKKEWVKSSTSVHIPFKMNERVNNNNSWKGRGEKNARIEREDEKANVS